MINLKTAEKFHGHLGPWLVLGLLMGEYGLKKIKAKKHFGLKVEVSGLNKRPRSCLIDGLQLSTGATLGKGNIKVNGDKKIKVSFINCENKKSISLGLKNKISINLGSNMTHKQAECLARRLFKIRPKELFKTLN